MCLIARAPMTGSELTRLLTRYPLAGTGKSPGAVYPALYRLAEAGLVCGRPRWVRSDRSQALRARLRRAAAGGPLMARERGTVREFGLTHMGVVRLRVWATRRVTRTEVLERPEHLMLRFSLCTGLVGPSAARRVALQCRRVCRDLVADMSREIAGRGGTASPSARLAMECSLDLLEARVGWSRRAEWELARQARREPELDTPSPTREVMVVLDGLPRRIRKRIRCPLRGELSPTGRSRTERTRRARRIGWEPGRGPRARPP
jgi:DNA-binding transcriptional ArsR family regulator